MIIMSFCCNSMLLDWMFSLAVAYLAGVVSVLIVEAGLLLFFIRRLVRRWQSRSIRSEAKPNLVSHVSASTLLSKQGRIWVAVTGPSLQEKDMKGFCNQQVKGLKEPKTKKDSVKETPEVLPVQKYAKLKDHILILTDSDGSEEVIELQGCTIRAVSGGDQSARKWAKRYPIKMENKNRVLVNRSKVCFFYLETAWEKEAWCKVLRLASRTDLRGSDPGGVDWYWNLKKEFESYFQRVNQGYSSFLKSNSVPTIQRDTNIKGAIASSKARHFWKKFARKAPRIGYEVTTNSIPTSSQEEKKASAKESRNLDSSSLTDFSSKAGPAEKNTDNRFHTDSSSRLGSSGSQRQSVSVSDMDSEKSTFPGSNAGHDSSIADQETLCCNLLFSRLFFDAERSPDVVARIQALIQRLLSKVRTPSYVGGINCTRLDLGKLPPHISNMRVLPVSIGEAWALEVDIEYFGAALMDIETRLEVCEPSFQESIAGTSVESEIAVEKSVGILDKDNENISNQLQTVTIAREKKDEEETSDGIKNSSGGSRRSWKGLLSHLADQVSQVPLALSIRVLSLKGTVRISIKPPPSDCIWFGFTAVPDIEWGFEPSIGEHKITSGTVAALIATRIKVRNISFTFCIVAEDNINYFDASTAVY
ncbi:uncharacterized protein LOC131064376 [Cryptomeria japonica]|uniref:uncharacterized protein LOC131064376 n=1 Tax=Cryptomeria japonica TaxID=3369 RepID=UPI0027DA0825|nr:uncharacterized protein LOC131064376 [Cryptomeria japonica]